MSDAKTCPELLEIEGLELRYGRQPVLQDLNLQVSRGRWIALLGPNASGKTTLLHCVAGQLAPARGSVRIEGAPLYPVRPTLRRLPGHAASPEDLPSFLTLRQCVEVFAAAHAIPALPPDVELLHDQLGLPAHDQQLVRSASLGTRQKLAIVLALMRQPSLLLLDEVFNGLDFGSALVLKEHLRARVAGGLSILLATHSLDVVLGCCDGLVLLDSGRLLRSWNAAELAVFRSAQELERELASVSRSSSA